MQTERFVKTDLLYANRLAEEEDVRAFRMEGEGAVSFPRGRLRMESLLDASEGQRANIVFWCPEDFPDAAAFSWEFWPIHEPGLCMFFFAARGRDGEDLFDPELELRKGIYHQYHHGNLDTYHVSYFRRWDPERQLHICNLRKSYGAHLVSSGGDPIPSTPVAKPPYQICTVVCDGEIEFSINNLPLLQWADDGTVGGPPLRGGKVGLRQMAPLIAEYANLEVHKVEKQA